MRFSCTVSQGNTEPCCEMRMPFESGFRLSIPSMKTAPWSGRRNPAIMFIRVVLPQPEGPMIATNSPSPTPNPTASTTGRAPLSETNALLMLLMSILVRIAPPDELVSFQQAHAAIQHEADQPNDDHARDDQVISVAGVA